MDFTGLNHDIDCTDDLISARRYAIQRAADYFRHRNLSVAVVIQEVTNVVNRPALNRDQIIHFFFLHTKQNVFLQFFQTRWAFYPNPTG